jgi:hypothetical protein
MKKRIVFVFALFVMSVFINATSISGRMVARSGNAAVQGYPQCQAGCYAMYFYCQQMCNPYGGPSCLQQCTLNFETCYRNCPTQ